MLKYIADTLRKDKDHVREGSVSLNGIPSDDPSTYWSVSIMEMATVGSQSTMPSSNQYIRLM